MNITFLGQGYEPESINSVGNHLLKLLKEYNFHTFYAISAFASLAGIKGLSEYFKKANINYNIIVGVDQEGTSKEALYEILALGINSYIFYQRESLIFHPKIYLFEGDTETKLILGSSNLTARGLFNNVESSLLIEFNNDDDEGIKLLSEIKNYYKGFFNLKDPNLFKITSEIIELFFSEGLIPTENFRNMKYGKKLLGKENNLQEKGKLNIPKRTSAKLPTAFKGKSQTLSTIIKVIEELELPETEIPQNKILVWSKAKLSNSDALRVSSGTNITGNIRLAQGGFKVNNVLIDQKKYFREIVFKDLKWTNPKNNSYEESYTKFQVIILGNNLGLHSLKISYDPKRIANQNNTPTWLHWGNSLIPYLKKFNIENKTLNLFFIENNSSFLIEII